MMWSLINPQLKLLCRYSTEERIGSDFGPSWKGMTKIRKRSRRPVETWRQWPWRSSPVMDGDLAIEFAANILIVQTVGLLSSNEQSHSAFSVIRRL
jgi:hypothetical protein